MTTSVSLPPTRFAEDFIFETDDLDRLDDDFKFDENDKFDPNFKIPEDKANKFGMDINNPKFKDFINIPVPVINIEQARLTYQAKCQACHRADGSGMGSKIKTGTRDIVSVIKNGTQGGMPNNGSFQLNDTQIIELAEYIKQTFRR